MQFPESWLRSFCNPPLNTQALSDTLTMAGLEVEELQTVAPPFSGIVVAEILTAEPHPNADKLRVCQVDAGPSSPNGPLQIVCGAPNARAGLRVPLATVGADLPPGADGKPFKIGVGKLRGVESYGMLCSARELQLSDDHGGLLELPADAPLGQNVREFLNLDDTLFTLKLTPNLGHALSVWGVARELSALTGVPLTPTVITPVEPQHDAVLPIKIEAPDLCGRFSGRIIRGVDAKAPTPPWMVERLARCGQRSVSALVDISNYVMFELGRPSHIFDLDKIHGGLTVRWGRAGERLKLLNGNTIELDDQVGVIADQQAVESLAGIMGGDATAVGDDTRNIYVEAAFWWPEAVAGRSRRFNFSTDAGHRFERGVDPASTVEHIERLTELILQICGGQPGPIDDQQPRMPQREPVRLRVARASRVLGMPLTAEQVGGVFTRLGLVHEWRGGDCWVTPPSWRFDLSIEEDLIEEVIRILGLQHLPTTPPQASIQARALPETRRSAHQLRRQVAGLGYFETINFSFVEARWESELAGNANPIRVLNPIAAPLSVMRSSLIGSLVHVLRTNLSRRASRVQVFEMGRVFRRDASVQDGPLSVAGVHQPMRLAGLAWGSAAPTQWAQKDRLFDFFDVKADVEALLAPWPVAFSVGDHPAMHPGRCAQVKVNDDVVGHVGEMHPRWRQAYDLPSAPMLFELDLDALRSRPVPVFQTLPRHQTVIRDLALVCREHISFQSLQAALLDDGQGLIRQVTLFDVYEPMAGAPGFHPGERSLALRLELLDDVTPLTDERIEAAVQAALVRVQQAVGARLRG